MSQRALYIPSLKSPRRSVTRILAAAAAATTTAARTDSHTQNRIHETFIAIDEQVPESPRRAAAETSPAMTTDAQGASSGDTPSTSVVAVSTPTAATVARKDSYRRPNSQNYNKVVTDKMWAIVDRCIQELGKTSELALNRLDPDPLPRRGGTEAYARQAKQVWNHNRRVHQLHSRLEDDAAEKMAEIRTNALLRERRGSKAKQIYVLSDQAIEESLRGEKYTPVVSDIDTEVVDLNIEPASRRQSGSTLATDPITNYMNKILQEDQMMSRMNALNQEEKETEESTADTPESSGENENEYFTGLIAQPAKKKRSTKTRASNWVSPALAVSLGLGHELLNDQLNNTPKAGNGKSRQATPRPSLALVTQPEYDFDIELSNFPLPIPRRLPFRALQASNPEMRLRMLRHFQATRQQIPQGPADGMLSAAARPHPQTLTQASSAAPVALQILQQLVPPSLDTHPTRYGCAVSSSSDPNLPTTPYPQQNILTLPPENPATPREFVGAGPISALAAMTIQGGPIASPWVKGGNDTSPASGSDRACIRVNFAPNRQKPLHDIENPAAKAKQLTKLLVANYERSKQYYQQLKQSQTQTHSNNPEATMTTVTRPISSNASATSAMTSAHRTDSLELPGLPARRISTANQAQGELSSILDAQVAELDRVRRR